MAVRIGILGDFNPDYHTHHATNASLEQATDTLAGYDGLWASPGSPYRSMCGMLAGIKYARVRNRPLVAT